MKFSFFSVYSRGREKKEDARRAFVLFALSRSLFCPDAPIPCVPLSHREQRQLLDGRARARVPRIGHRFSALGEVQSCFYRSSSERECCSLFSFARREIPRRKKEQLERERPVFELSFSSRYARSRVLRSPLSLWRLAERERAKGGRRERERERAVEGQRRCRRRRRHEGDGDCSSVSSVRSPAFGCSSLFTQQCVHNLISTNTAER